MGFFSQKDMEDFQTAVTLSNSYSIYEAICSEMRLDPHSYILKYIVELVQQPKSPFYFKETFLGDDFFLPIYEFLKKNILAENLVFQDVILNDDKRANIILQLITNFSRSQLTHLSFKKYSDYFVYFFS